MKDAQLRNSKSIFANNRKPSGNGSQIDRGWLPRSAASLAAERGDADVDVESKFNETLALATEWTRHLTGSDAADAGVVEADVRHLVAFETRLAQVPPSLYVYRFFFCYFFFMLVRSR